MNIENIISQEENVLRIFVLKVKATVKKLANYFILNNVKSTICVFCKNKLLPEKKIGTRRTSWNWLCHLKLIHKNVHVTTLMTYIKMNQSSQKSLKLPWVTVNQNKAWKTLMASILVRTTAMVFKWKYDAIDTRRKYFKDWKLSMCDVPSHDTFPWVFDILYSML